MEIKKYNGVIGTINGIAFYDQHLLNTVEYLLEQIEDYYGDCYNNEFVSDLADVCETIYLKYDDISYGEIEHEFCISIDKCAGRCSLPFNSLKLDIYGDTWKFEWFNEKLHNGSYLKTEEALEEASDEDLYCYAVSSVKDGYHNLVFHPTPQQALQSIIDDFLANNRVHDGLIHYNNSMSTVEKIDNNLKANVMFNLCGEQGLEIEAGMIIKGNSLSDPSLSVNVYDYSRDIRDSWAIHIFMQVYLCRKAI